MTETKISPLTTEHVTAFLTPLYEVFTGMRNSSSAEMRAYAHAQSADVWAIAMFCDCDPQPGDPAPKDAFHRMFGQDAALALPTGEILIAAYEPPF